MKKKQVETQGYNELNQSTVTKAEGIDQTINYFMQMRLNDFAQVHHTFKTIMQ